MRRPLTVTVLLLALVSAGCSLLGGNGTMDVQAEFRRTFNLFPQSPVRVLGVQVGQVIDLETEPGSDVVTVTMRIDDDVDLSADSDAVIITASLLGERYVQLVDGDGEDPLADGDLIEIADTKVPFEFDEVLEGLNDFVGGLEEQEVARLVTNLADLLEGNGAQLGQTIDAASGAVAALKENDEELIAIAGAVADLNETLATRDQELAALLDDWIRVSDTLTSETTDLDGALENLVVLTREIAELMIDHREELSADIDTLTRVGRSATRNLDNFEVAILGSAELFRHAGRVVNPETNMLPLVNHSEELATSVEDSLFNRLEGLCLGAGGSTDDCSLDAIQDGLSGDGGELCIEPFLPCGDGDFTVSDAVIESVDANALVAEGLVQQRSQQQADGDGPQTEEQGAIDRALEQLGLTDDGGDR